MPARSSTDQDQGRVTHHERILTTLRQQITSGAWQPGFQLPFETQLAEDHGVSRMTMNKVLSQLTREGFLVRQKKLGTFVARPVSQSATMQISDIEAEVAALGLKWNFELLDRKVRRPTLTESRSAKIKDLDKRVLALRGIHRADDQPFCFEARIVNTEVAPGVLDADFRSAAPGAWLLREIPWSSAENRIRAVSVTGAVARELELPSGSACLEVARRTEIAGNWVTLVTQTYPGDRHELVAQFAPAPNRPG